jgi:hypothetical protein
VSDASTGNSFSRDRTKIDAIEFLGPTDSKIETRFASVLKTRPLVKPFDFAWIEARDREPESDSALHTTSVHPAWSTTKLPCSFERGRSER